MAVLTGKLNGLGSVLNREPIFLRFGRRRESAVRSRIRCGPHAHNDHFVRLPNLNEILRNGLERNGRLTRLEHKNENVIGRASYTLKDKDVLDVG